MTFEFDPIKSASNFSKHGISFEDAQALWDDPLVIEFKAKTMDEQRFLVIGQINEKHWSAIITYREETVRIISVRRSRLSERALYESHRF